MAIYCPVCKRRTKSIDPFEMKFSEFFSIFGVKLWPCGDVFSQGVWEEWLKVMAKEQELL